MSKKFWVDARELFSRLDIKRLSIVLVALSYVFFTAYYMGPSVWNCGDTLYGFGDNTAGPVWKFGLEPDQAPLGSFTTATNYPVGENLFTPMNYSLSGQSYMIWGASKALGPECGYNVFNMVGFIASALVMFGFIYSLTKSKWIAWLAGYAVSFTPYYQMKVGGHPGYGFQALLIGIAWAFFNLLKKRRKRDAFYLGALMAFCFYFDPYFSLLAGSIIGPLLLVWGVVAYLRFKKKRIKKTELLTQLRLFGVSLGVFILFLSPLVAVLLSHGKEISSSVASYRGNVLFEARACSNLPHEYALPFVLHPVFERLLGGAEYTRLIDRMHNGFSCGIGEDTVGVSMIILTIVSIGLIIFAWEALNRRRIKLNLHYDKRVVFVGLVCVGVVAIIMALPPLKIFGIPTPSYALLMITTTWRTLTRFYVVVNFVSVSLLAIFLVYIYANFKPYRKWLKIAFAILFLTIFVEYQAFRPFTGNQMSTFSYAKDVPPAYTWLKDQEDIKVVAEYPLERSGGESNAMAYYLSMQVAHGKILFNGNIPTSEEEELRASLKDISDPQTQAVLYTLGVDAVVIHGVNPDEVRKIPGLEIIHSSAQAPFNILAFTPLVKVDDTVIVRIKQRDTTQNMLAFDSGFVRNATIIRSAADWEYEALNNSRLRVSSLPGKETDSNVSAQCFSIRLAGENEEAELVLSADDEVVRNMKISSTYQVVKLSAGSYIELSNSKGYNFRVKDLGCK